MAALYLHNAIFIPETPRSGDLPAPHTRTLSSGTLRTVASEGHPTEPLLDTQTPDHQSQAFQELLSLQPSHPHGPDAGWDMRLSLDGLRSGRSSPGVVGEEAIRRRLNQLRWAIVVIQLIIAVWVTYTAIRYFISFGKYQSSAGQSLSVALGTSSLVSVVYLACTQAMRVARPYLASFDVPLRYIRIAETIFRALASIFFATPALINFILVLIYKSSGNYEMVVSNRCVLDADLVWAGGNSSCTNSESQWGAWVGLSALRLILTVALVVIFHSCVLSFQHIVLYPTGKNYTEPPHRRRNKRSSKSHQTGTTSTSRAHLTSPPMSMSSASSFPTTIQPVRHPSVSQSSANSAQLLALARVPSDPNQVGRVSPSRVQASTHRSRSTSPSQHPAHYYTESDVERLARTSQGSSSPAGDPGPSSASNMDDRELNAFVDQFRSMVTQISREAEEAIEFAQPGPTGSYRNSFDMGPPLPSAIIGYDELGRPYGAEEHVRILNGFVRRMPTIESIGSRELGSMRSMASNLEQERIERMTSLQELSRPGTQLTMRTDTTTTDYGQIIRSGLYGPGSAPPSRSNSINTGPSRANSVNWTGTPGTTHPEFEAPWANGQQPPSPVSPISPIAAAILRGSSIAASSGSSSGHSTSEATTGSGAASFHTAGSGNDRSTEPRQPLIPHPYRTASPTEMSPV